jgi:ApaG protein
MVVLITSGIKITVKCAFQADVSNPMKNSFLFGYFISIENTNSFAVQLLRRHWRIFDSNGTLSVVDGEGIVGLQPIIEPGGSHEYNSWCSLTTEIGTMEGHYEFIRVFDKEFLKAKIPKFHLIAPFKNN